MIFNIHTKNFKKWLNGSEVRISLVTFYNLVTFSLYQSLTNTTKNKTKKNKKTSKFWKFEMLKININGVLLVKNF